MIEFSCPGCRTALQLGVDACTGCGAPIAWSYCGACLAANAPGAATCVACGRPLDPGARALPDRFPCPRCEAPMARREITSHAVHECARCRGAFVDHLTLERLAAEGAPPPGAAAPRMTKASRPTTPVVYIRCPGCAEVMNRVQFGRHSGIVVDVCRRHGTFFDPQELERAREFVSAGLSKRREADEDAAQSAARKQRRAGKKGGKVSPRENGPAVSSDDALIAIAREIAHWLRR